MTDWRAPYRLLGHQVGHQRDTEVRQHRSLPRKVAAAETSALPDGPPPRREVGEA
jgi:hypothetical protein